MNEEKLDVMIIGAGIAGLSAAKLLKAAGKKIMVVEASDAVGGRLRSDYKDGFILDRGFQVLFTAYPEAKALLDYEELDLKPFKPGATILDELGKHTVSDPLREPALLMSTLRSPIASFKDKLLLLWLKLKLSFTSEDQIFAKKETSTLLYLQQFGFSERFIQKFFVPFFSGIFLENQLATSSRMFEFLFKMLNQGLAAVPADGMGMISQQLANSLRYNEIVLNEKIVRIENQSAFGASGKVYNAKAFIISSYNPELIGKARKLPLAVGKSALTLYFSTPNPLQFSNRIVLNAMPNQLINNIAFISDVAPSYAPQGQSLISVSIHHLLVYQQSQLEQTVKSELIHWYPDAVNWKLISIYAIPYALPENSSVRHNIIADELKSEHNKFICGDYMLNGSINGAMKSARLAVKELLASKVLN